MAYYNSVGTPKFYINIVEWLMNNGVTDDILFDLEIYGNLFRTLPVTPMTLSSSVGASLKFNIPNIAIKPLEVIPDRGVSHPIQL